jgi:hypothetical protein
VARLGALRVRSRVKAIRADNEERCMGLPPEQGNRAYFSIKPEQVESPISPMGDSAKAYGRIVCIAFRV